MKLSKLQVELIGIAAKLFMQYGFKRVTVDEIAREAGISKKTLYENFEDKNLIVLLAIKQHLQQMLHNIKTISQKSKHAIDEMVQVMHMMEQNMCSMNPVGPLDLQRYYPEAHQYLQAFTMQEMVSSLERNLKKGIQEELYRTNINVTITATFRVESILLLMRKSHEQKNSASFAKMQRELMEQFLYGISTLKGHKLIQKNIEELNKQ